MRLLNILLLAVILFVGSGSILTREEANIKLQELEEIGETDNPKLLDKKAIISNDLALFYQSINNNEQSIVFLQQAIDYTKKRIEIEQLWSAQDLRDLLDLHLNKAKVEATAGYLDQAENSFQKAEKYFQQLRPLLSEVDYYTTATAVYTTAFSYCYHLKAFSRAENYGLKCLQFSEKSEVPKLIGESNRLLGELYRSMDKTDKAMQYFDAAILAYRSRDKNSSIPQKLIQSKIGNLYSQKRYGEVIAFMKSESLFETIESLENNIKNISVSEYSVVLTNIFVLTYAQIRQFQRTNDKQLLQSALAWQNCAYDLAEYAIIENGVDRLGQVISKPEQKITSTLKNYELLQEEGVLTQNEIGQLVRTLDVFHSTQLHLNRIQNEVNGKDWNRQKFLQEDLKRLFKQMQTAEGNEERLVSLQQKSKEITQELSILALSTKKDEIATEYQLGQKEFLSRLKQYSKQNKKTVLTYYWSKPLSRVFIIGRNPDRYLFRVVEVEPDFISKLNELYQLNSRFLTNPEQLNHQDSLNCALYDIIVKPIEKEITTSNVLVYPMGTMSYISFEALKPSKSTYLIEDRNISYTSSLFALLRKTKNKNSSNKVLAFQPEHYGNDSLATLFHVQNEISTLDSCVETRTFKGDRATKKQFLKSSNNAQILHVASHSILNSENPYNSYLIFEEKDSTIHYQLKASEIFSTAFQAQLVVLSSCNSAKGIQNNDIGIVSLSNAFYFSGVPSTLGSLWSAQDQSSSKIISGFYRHLFNNVRKSESLTMAKRNYLKNADALKSQPFFWSNYVLYGDDSKIHITTEENATGSWQWIIIGVIILLALILYKRFRRARVFSK
ncbi:MAG: CHAT domain-containing protein [Fluviicola sp.]